MECCLSRGDALALDWDIWCLSSRIASSGEPWRLGLLISADAGLDMLQEAAGGAEPSTGSLLINRPKVLRQSHDCPLRQSPADKMPSRRCILSRPAPASPTLDDDPSTTLTASRCLHPEAHPLLMEQETAQCYATLQFVCSCRWQVSSSS